MSLYDVVLPYMHDVGLVNHMMKVFLGMYEVVYTFLVDVWIKWYSCSLFVGLFSICEVMGLHMYNALVDLD